MPKIRLRRGEEPVEVSDKTLLMGLNSEGPIKVKGRQEIEILPQLPMVLHSLLLDRATGESFVLANLRVGASSQLISSDSIPLSPFIGEVPNLPEMAEFAVAEEGMRELFDLEPCLPGMAMRFDVINEGGAAVPFRGCAVVRLVEGWQQPRRLPSLDPAKEVDELDGWRAEDHTDLVMGELVFKSKNAIAPGDSVDLEAMAHLKGETCPARQMMVKPMMFLNPPLPTGKWAVESIRIAGCEQFFSTGPVPVEVFVAAAGNHSCEVQTVGQETWMRVVNMGAEHAFFEAHMAARFGVPK